jgi:DNA helicase HerA-like ATPase
MNRHGLVAGATGTGKTKTLQLMAEQLSAMACRCSWPTSRATCRGSGDAGGRNASDQDAVEGRSGRPGPAAAFPVEFFALGGQGSGIPMRATITAFGPTLLAKVLGLNETQESSLGLVFHYADKQGLALLDLKDLRAVVQHLTSDEGKAELKASAACRRRPRG